MSIIKCWPWGSVASSNGAGEEGLEILSFLLGVYLADNSPEAHSLSLYNNYSASHQGSLIGQGENNGLWMVWRELERVPWQPREILVHHLASAACVFLCVLPQAQAVSTNMSCYMIHPALASK